MSRDIDELLGSSAGTQTQIVVTPGGISIEDNDSSHDPLDVDESPFVPKIADDDGYPGFKPAVDDELNFDREGRDSVDRVNDEAEIHVLGDSFAHRIETMHEAQAQTTVGGAPPSDLASLHRFEELRHRAESQRAPYANPNPESTYRALLGGNAVQNATNTQTLQQLQALYTQVASWQGEDVECRPVVVTFAPIIAPVMQGIGKVAFANPGTARPVGRVYFGTRSQSYTLDVDINLGVQFAISASQVSLLVGLDPLAATSDPVQLALGGSLGFYPTLRTSPITRTIYFDPIPSAGGAGSIVNGAIPFFARRVQLWTTDQSNAVTLSILDIQQHGVISETGAQNTGIWIPIPNDGFTWAIQNVGGGAAVNGRLVFELAI